MPCIKHLGIAYRYTVHLNYINSYILYEYICTVYTHLEILYLYIHIKWFIFICFQDMSIHIRTQGTQGVHL